MRFTKKNSIQEIMAELQDDSKKFFDLLFSMELVNMVSKEFWNHTLEEVEKLVVMPWGLPFPADSMLHSANVAADNKYQFISLWKPEEYVPDIEGNNKNSVFLMHTGESVADGKRPAAIICPGGGYETLSTGLEGTMIAEAMEAAGYCTFVLKYRLKPVQYPEQQKDLLLAIKYVRANAEKYGIDADRILIMGSSAGGHLCASAAGLYKEIEPELMRDLEKEQPELAERYRNISVRPNQVCLNYPVISFVQETHEESFQALTGGNEELRKKLSAEFLVSESYPKTFVWACEDDALVPASNAKRMGAALSEKNVSYKMKIYPYGGHGCGLAYGTSVEGWFEEMLLFMKGKNENE